MTDNYQSVVDSTDAAEGFYERVVVDCSDGGLAAMKTLVDQIFYDAGYYDATPSDLNIADDLLAIAAAAIKRGRASARPNEATDYSAATDDSRWPKR